MNLKSLQKLVKQGECETIEFKRITGQRTEAMKTVCAMLNGNGGYVVFGVTDKKEMKGQEVNAKTLKEIADELARIKPPAFPEIEKIQLNNEHTVIVLRISKGSSQPYLYDNRPYQRSGSTTRNMSQTTYEKILIERLHDKHRWENQFAPKNISVKDLDEEEIQLTVDNAIDLGRLQPLKNRRIIPILKGLGLIQDDRLLNAAVVLYAKNPEIQITYPQCEIRLARFRGVNKLAEFTDNKQYWGNAFSLLRHAELFLRDHVPIAGRIVSGKMRREDRPLYSPPATREALANALCHRDYTISGGAIGVAMYDDRLEIISPGSLHFGLTPESLMKSHESRPWNPIIASVFYRAGIIEKWGSGITKIIDKCHEIEAPTPEWVDRKLDTVIVFYPAKEFAEAIPKQTPQVTRHVGRQVTRQVTKQILNYCQEPHKASEILMLLKLKDRENFYNNYLYPLIDEQLLALTIPDKPQSRLQQYVITAKGEKWLKTNY